jgi:c-di-GMP-binding flagellar brake protein YcgR
MLIWNADFPVKKSSILWSQAVYEKEFSKKGTCSIARSRPVKQCKREYSRVDVSWPVAMLTSKKLILGKIKNISVGGALISCQELPSPEESLELRIEITDLFYVSASVENVRINVDNSHSDSIDYDLAVSFTEMTEDDRRNLYNAIEQEARKKKN